MKWQRKLRKGTKSQKKGADKGKSDEEDGKRVRNHRMLEFRAQIESDWVSTHTSEQKRANRIEIKIRTNDKTTETARKGCEAAQHKWKTKKHNEYRRIRAKAKKKKELKPVHTRTAYKFRIFMWIFPFQITSI